MVQLNFPHGEQAALVGQTWALSFDELHQLRFCFRAEMHERLDGSTKRVIGCLRDDETALFALLFISELFEYMPINPSLSDTETSRLVKDSGAETVVLSAGFLEAKSNVFNALTIIDWDELTERALKRLGSEQPLPQVDDTDFEGCLVLHTSGSTGLPKRVPISISSIEASAKSARRSRYRSA